MKRLIARIAFWLPLLIAGGHMNANAQFEGVVESKNLTVDETDTPRTFSMIIWLGKGKMRVETGAIGTTPASTMIYRPDRGVFWILNVEEKTYIEVLQNPEPAAPTSPRFGKRENRRGSSVTDVTSTSSVGRVKRPRSGGRSS
jgi:hypothetical protein